MGPVSFRMRLSRGPACTKIFHRPILLTYNVCWCDRFMWAAGTTAEPLMSDEQPQSWMFVEADIHTDRLIANKQRAVSWDYRQMELCPMELMPGFFSHQTSRYNLPGRADFGQVDTRVRDFGLVGYKYSLMSSIATGGLHSVINLLPSRDYFENKFFPKADAAFIRDWLDWTDRNVGVLKAMAPIAGWGRPGIGKVDGNMAVVNGSGVAFFFNPTAREINKTIKIDESWHFDCGADASHFNWTELFPAKALRFAPACGTALQVSIPPTTAMVFEISPLSRSAQPTLVGASGKAVLDGTTLRLTGVQGEVGTEAAVEVRWFVSQDLVAAGATLAAQDITRVTVNDADATFSWSAAEARGGHHHVLRLCGRFGSEGRFRHMQEIGSAPSDFRGGAWGGNFNVPSAVIDQLAARNASYPIPWGENESAIPWLSPGRLLAFVKYSPLVDDTLNVTSAYVDDPSNPVHFRKAWNTVSE
eukprot:SAG22_NODE_402_length_11035_cov_6.315929_2_plen_473_part_00